MFLSELHPGDSVSLTVTNEDGAKLVIHTSVIELPEMEKARLTAYLKKTGVTYFCALEHLTSDQASINFLTQNSTLNVSINATHKNQPYMWSKSRIIRIKSGDKTYHIAVCKYKGASVNRRETFRLDMDIAAQFVKSGDPAAVDVILRDISENGMGLKCDNDISVEVGDIITVSFVYDRYDRDLMEYEKVPYSIPAKVVRIIPTTDSKILMGCRMKGTHDAVRTLIYDEQRERFRQGRR